MSDNGQQPRSPLPLFPNSQTICQWVCIRVLTALTITEHPLLLFSQRHFICTRKSFSVTGLFFQYRLRKWRVNQLFVTRYSRQYNNRTPFLTRTPIATLNTSFKIAPGTPPPHKLHLDRRFITPALLHIQKQPHIAAAQPICRLLHSFLQFPHYCYSAVVPHFSTLLSHCGDFNTSYEMGSVYGFPRK